MKSPTIVDLLPKTPYNDQVANCCKGGVISVGAEGTTNTLRCGRRGLSVVTKTHEAAVAYAAVYLIKAPSPSFLYLSSSSE
ncbi:hypothetical protein C3L33_12453, partial [Rhododendron williamsianum]